jgi:hypothetical protein
MFVLSRGEMQVYMIMSRVRAGEIMFFDLFACLRMLNRFSLLV